MENVDMSLEYICTRLGEEESANVNFGAVIPPVYATSLHVFENIEGLLNYDPDNPGGRFVYGRVDNPTTCLLEKKLAALERADGALCFASGMAAITSAIMYCVKPGDHVVAVKNCYGPTRTFLENYIAKRGIEVTFITGMDELEFERETRQNTAMFYLESPSTAVMELQDLRAVAEIAKKRGIKTVIDNTWATPVYQQPLTLGVDIVVHTMSKYIGGHSDIIGGALCANGDIIKSIKHGERELLGGIIGPFEAWLALRGLRTLSSRLAKSGKNGLAVAKLLDENKRVRRVNYPGVDSYRQNDIAKKQMTGGSGLLSFELDGTTQDAIAFANNLKYFRKGVSWGGFESLVCMPMYKFSEEEAKNRNSDRNLIRLYCGLEDTQELLDDITSALKKLG